MTTKAKFYVFVFVKQAGLFRGIAVHPASGYIPVFLLKAISIKKTYTAQMGTCETTMTGRFYRLFALPNKVYDVKLQTLKIPTDSVSYQASKHVADIRGCLGCHTADLGGGTAFLTDSTPIGVLYATNITSGKGGIDYTDQGLGPCDMA